MFMISACTLITKNIGHVLTKKWHPLKEGRKISLIFHVSYLELFRRGVNRGNTVYSEWRRSLNQCLIAEPRNQYACRWFGKRYARCYEAHEIWADTDCQREERKRVSDNRLESAGKRLETYYRQSVSECSCAEYMVQCKEGEILGWWAVWIAEQFQEKVQRQEEKKR